MLRFLEAGLFAAARQVVAIMVVTLIVMLLVSQDLIDSGAGSDPPDMCRFISRFLGGAYLLTAMGLVLTRDRSVTATADRIRYAARLINPEHRATVLAVQLVLSSILLALFALRAPPLLLTEIVKYSGVACAAPAVWTGIISIGVAFLGANAHAAIRAL